jgi:hypothetical protein
MFLFFTFFSLLACATDFDEDEMPDEWERKNGLRVDKVDAHEDADNDGLTHRNISTQPIPSLQIQMMMEQAIRMR